MLMIYKSSTTSPARSAVAEVADLDAARAYLAGKGEVVCFEVDETYPACADALVVEPAVNRCDCYAIEPAGFTMTKGA